MGNDTIVHSNFGNIFISLAPFRVSIAQDLLEFLQSIHLPASNGSGPNISFHNPLSPTPLTRALISLSIILRSQALITRILPSGDNSRTILPTASKGQCRTFFHRVLTGCCVEFKRLSTVRAFCYEAGTVLVSFVYYLAHLDGFEDLMADLKFSCGLSS